MNATQTRKPQVSSRLVKAMVGFYGGLEAAREAYRAKREQVREAGKLAGKCLWVSSRGEILVKDASEIFYAGSPDAPNALPCR